MLVIIQYLFLGYFTDSLCLYDASFYALIADLGQRTTPNLYFFALAPVFIYF